MLPSPSLKLEKVTVSFGQNSVLRDLDAAFNSEEVNFLMGANGSGKTTVFNTISGSLKATAGKVYLELGEKEVLVESLSKSVSRSFQTNNVFGSLSVYDNLNIASGFNESEVPECRQYFLEKTGLLEVLNISANSLSYGQRKLLSLAMACSRTVPVYLFDEPTAGLQPKYLELVEELIRCLKGVRVVIEHNLDFVALCNARVHFLNNGRIVFSGGYDRLSTVDEVKVAYL